MSIMEIQFMWFKVFFFKLINLLVLFKEKKNKKNIITVFYMEALNE